MQAFQSNNNIIVVYPPSNTLTSEADSSVIEAQETKQRVQNPVASNPSEKDKKQTYNFNKRYYVPRCIYRLFKTENVTISNRKRETNQCFPFFKQTKRRAHHTPTQPERHKKKQKMIWCFREMCSTAVFIESKRQDIPWTPFQRKNQVLLTQQLELFERDIRNDSCKLQERRIRNGKIVVTVWLQEAMAFALDPELSEPITFEIARFPKLNWYQKILIRHQHRQLQRKAKQAAGK